METTTTYLGKKQETPNAYSFYFARPDGFTYRPGQFMFVTVPHDRPDERGDRRHFSLSSSPTEEKLMVTTKISDPGSTYKKALLDLPEQTEVAIRGPHGEFLLPEDSSQPVVFLGGGIGITPFRSMIKEAVDQSSTREITLLYANKTPTDIIYRNEFDQWTKDNPNFRLTYTVDEPSEGWNGETGHLTAEMIKKYVPDQEKPWYYICGPQGMIDSYAEILTDLGVASEKIVTEDFSGY